VMLRRVKLPTVPRRSCNEHRAIWVLWDRDLSLLKAMDVAMHRVALSVTIEELMSYQHQRHLTSL
jgi:hypothetical protein